jgi:hypothetical protein
MEAFLKGFQISSEIAKAKARGQARIGREEWAIFDTYESAFVQAYERAKILKKTLEQSQVLEGRESKKAIQALDVFLRVGEEFEQAVKSHAKAQAVEHAKQEIENALRRVEKTVHDERTELEALEEIERTVQDMKKNIADKKSEN